MSILGAVPYREQMAAIDAELKCREYMYAGLFAELAKKWVPVHPVMVRYGNYFDPSTPVGLY